MHDERLNFSSVEKLDIARQILEDHSILIYKSTSACLTFGLPTLLDDFAIFIVLRISYFDGMNWVCSANLTIRSVSLKFNFKKISKDMGEEIPLITKDDVHWDSGVWTMSSKNILWHSKFSNKKQKVPISKKFDNASILLAELKKRNLQNVIEERCIMAPEDFDGKIDSALKVLKAEYEKSKKSLTAIKILRSFRK